MALSISPETKAFFAARKSDLLTANSDTLGKFDLWPLRMMVHNLSLIHISEPTRLRRISYAVFCLKKKKEQKEKNQNTNTPTTSTLPSFIFFLMIRRPPRSTPKPSSAASDVYKRQRLSRRGRGMLQWASGRWCDCLLYTSPSPRD